AFNIDPVFDYGYQTNAQGQYDFLMSVGDFIHTDGVTKIRIYDVTKDGVSMTPVLDESDYVYELFDTVVNTVSKGSGYVADEAAFKIIPAKKIHDGLSDHLGTTTIGSNVNYVDYADAEDSAPGSYTSTITIRIKAV
ncbi:hypothetical protein, partial [Sphaerochaeta sp.]|uniref:hypothetical protein n=1 Tax=Sphaerochaeta sp. TaxID=1972642 RepID=UPI002A359D25